MSQSRPNPFWSFLVGVGKFINFANHFVFNVVMLLLIFLVLLAIGAGFAANSAGGLHPLQDRTALVLDLKGTLVEQYTSAPLQRAIAQATGDDQNRELQLRDLTAAIDAARTDRRIQRIVLLTDGFDVSGFAALGELGAALREFRKSGKQLIAYGTMMEQKQYYLAAQADQVYLDPDGGVLLEGLGRYRLYYRQALQDKLGVDVHLFRVGEYKSAAEPFVLDAASKESREADLFWMNDLWQRYVDEVTQARELAPGELTALITDMPNRMAAVHGDLAQLALDEKLVDGLKTSHEMETLLAQLGAAGQDGDSFRQVDLSTYLAHVGRHGLELASKPQVAVVVAQGEIADGKQPQGAVGGESTAELIRQAREDDQVKALVLRVDSPGGSVFPSEQIRREIALTKEAGKPVVVSMGNLAASGGYWISMNADRIYADPSTITGSIGIFGLFANAPRALDKIGVHSDGVGTTPWAGAFDPTRALDPEAGRMIQSVIDHGYAQFIGKVAAARGSTPEAIDKIARGRVWSGAQAKERGLVDELGGLDAAQTEAAKLARLGDGSYELRYVEKPLGAFDKWLLDLGRNSRMAVLVRELAPFQTVLGGASGDQLRHDLGMLQASRGSAPVRALAYCFCGL